MTEKKQKTETTEVAQRPDAPNALTVVLDRGREQFEVALRGGPVSLGDFQVAIRSAAMASPELLQCMAEHPASVMQCLIEAAQLQLSPAPAKAHFHLIPRKIKGRLTCTRIIGKRGLIHLADRSGRIEEIDAMALYRADVERLKADRLPVVDPATGELNVSSDPFLREGEGEGNEEDLCGAVAWVRIKDRPRPLSRVLTRAQILKRRDVTGYVSPAWKEWPAEMFEKTALRALLTSGLVPLGQEADRVQQALAEAVLPEEHAEIVVLDDPPADPNDRLKARLDSREERPEGDPTPEELAQAGEEATP